MSDYKTVEGAKKVLSTLGEVLQGNDDYLSRDSVQKAINKIPPEVLEEAIGDSRFAMNLVADLPRALPNDVFNRAARSGIRDLKPNGQAIADLLHPSRGNPSGIDAETFKQILDRGHGDSVVAAGTPMPPGIAEEYFAKNPSSYKAWFRNGRHMESGLKQKIAAAPKAFEANLSDPAFAKDQIGAGVIPPQHIDKAARAALPIMDSLEDGEVFGELLAQMTPHLSHETTKALFDKGFGRDIVQSKDSRVPADILESHFERLKSRNQRAYVDDVARAMKSKSDLGDHRIADAYFVAKQNNFATHPLLLNRPVPKQLVDHIFDNVDGDTSNDAFVLANNKNIDFDPEHSRKILENPKIMKGLDRDVGEKHFRNAFDLLNSEQRKAISQHIPQADPDNWHSDRISAWGTSSSASEIESRGNKYLDIKNGTSRLRRLRDHILESGQTELKPNDFPQDLKPILQQMPFARTKAGNISADLLQQAIDKTPHNRYNYSHSVWDGVQRHSKEESKVFRLDATTSHLNEMHKAGVLGTFRNLQGVSVSHPINPNSIGWVRYTGDPKTGIFIDEIQSDHSVPLARKAAGEARHAGQDENAAYQAASEKAPEEHQKVINQILFGGTHPNRVVAEGFLQHFRDQGFPDVKIRMHSVETKAPISLGPDVDLKTVPVHMKETYDKLPKEWGMKPAKYGETPTESNPELHQKPIFEGKIRKAEDLAKADSDPYSYHVTYAGKLPKIAAEGLVPGQPRSIGGGAYDGHSRGKIFFADHEGARFWHSKSVDHAQHNHDDPTAVGAIPVVLRVPKKALRRKIADRPGTQDSMAPAYSVTHPVPADQIEVYHGSGWGPIGSNSAIDTSTGHDGAILHYAEKSGLYPRSGETKIPGISPDRIPHFEAVWSPGARVRTKYWGDAVIEHGLPRGTKEGSIRVRFDDGRSMDLNHEHVEPIKKSELSKAVDPSHFASIVKASDPAGANLVDHIPHLSSHPVSIQPSVDAYRSQVVHSDHRVGKQSTSGLGKGITKKVIFAAKVADKQQKYMVKPYHEKVISRVKGWMKFPIQGWAEMTHQALYHAAGIGHLHQKVHVDEHDMGPQNSKEPALVVHLGSGHRAVSEGAGMAFAGDENRESVRKIALMDFLSNNHDRHGLNLLVNSETSAPLAIDHSRSFQYIAPLQFPGRSDNEDSFGNYISKSAISNLDPLLASHAGPDMDDKKRDLLDRYAPVFEWWGDVGANVRSEFHKHLGQIKDPDVRDHIKRNFDSRADWLDERSRFGLKESYDGSWFRGAPDMYSPGQLTDREKSDPEYMAEYNSRKAARLEAKKKALAEKKAGVR